MKWLTPSELREAWFRPAKYEDPDLDFEVRLGAVQEAVLHAQMQLPLPQESPND